MMHFSKIIKFLLIVKVLKIGSIPIPIRNPGQNSAQQRGNSIPHSSNNKGPSSSHQGYREVHKQQIQPQIREVRQVLYHPAEPDHFKTNNAHHSDSKRNPEPHKFTVEWSIETPEYAKNLLKQQRPTQPHMTHMRAENVNNGLANNLNLNYIKVQSRDLPTNEHLIPKHQELPNPMKGPPSSPIHFHIMHANNNGRYSQTSENIVNTQLMNPVALVHEGNQNYNFVPDGKISNLSPQIEFDLELGDETFETKMEVEEL